MKLVNASAALREALLRPDKVMSHYLSRAALANQESHGMPRALVRTGVVLKLAALHSCL